MARPHLMVCARLVHDLAQIKVWMYGSFMFKHAVEAIWSGLGLLKRCLCFALLARATFRDHP